MKVEKKPTMLLYPCPVVLVTCIDEEGRPNIITLAWVGVVCSDPPTLGVSIRPHRYSHRLIEESGEFVVNIPSKRILRETDYCGKVSGKSHNKFVETNLTTEGAKRVKSPLIRECPVNMECVLKQIVKLGVHDLFLGEIVVSHVNVDVLDEKGGLDLNKAEPFVYSHMSQEYWSLGEVIGRRHGFPPMTESYR